MSKAVALLNGVLFLLSRIAVARSKWDWFRFPAKYLQVPEPGRALDSAGDGDSSLNTSISTQAKERNRDSNDSPSRKNKVALLYLASLRSFQISEIKYCYRPWVQSPYFWNCSPMYWYANSSPLVPVMAYLPAYHRIRNITWVFKFEVSSLSDLFSVLSG